MFTRQVYLAIFGPMRLLPALFALLHWIHVSAAEPVVAVAANLSKPVQALAANFTRDTGARMLLNFGSSGDLLRQIRQGAPFELYIAAVGDYTTRAQADGLTDGAPVVLALGNIGAFIPQGSSLEPAMDLAALGRLLSAGNYRRIAMANPEVAPFGTAAQQALRRMGVWAVEKDRLVLGENMAQTVQFTLAGGVDVGFIAQSYALLPEVSDHGRFLPVPADWHIPLAQTMVLLRGAGDEARSFFRYLQSSAARELLSRSGYTIPAP
ncbi:MAG: molybdate ABC transporter substrate-binding protein [Gammaproteobacteria bacterium]|nr:molybdate ABC transporter substrate-binding protein [Gammaproteobacteria bacterium]